MDEFSVRETAGVLKLPTLSFPEKSEGFVRLTERCKSVAISIGPSAEAPMLDASNARKLARQLNRLTKRIEDRSA